jgi:rare lipoprotein A
MTVVERPAWRRAPGWAIALLVLAGCAPNPTLPTPDAALHGRGPSTALSPPVSLGDVPADAPLSRVVPVEAGSAPPTGVAEEIEHGGASWYGPRFNGRRTASGERFDIAAMTAAHRTLPFGTLVCVHSVSTGRTTLVRVNDRGPRARQRVIDISQAAADELGIRGLGVTQVVLSLPPPDSEDCG